MRWFPTAMIMVLAGPCAVQGVSAQGRYQERDSAGVRIVAQAPSPVVRLVTSRVRFSVDGTESGGDPLHRINGVVALRDGIVVANAGTFELRYYGRDGSPRATAGRQGSGPGEFRIITWIQRMRGDSVLAYDGGNRRMSVWTSTGEHVRDIPVVLGRPRMVPGAVAAFPPSPLGMFSESEFFYVGSVSVMAVPDLQRASGALVMANLATQKGDTIAHVAVMDMQIAKENRGSSMRRVAFPRMLSYAFGDGEFAISDGAEYRIDRYSRSGRLTLSVRVQREPAEVSGRDRELFIDEEEVKSASDIVFGSQLPAYRRLWHDREGRLWAEVYRPPSAAESTWDVFDPAGRLIATIAAPSSLQLMAADATQVYAIHTDELDVPAIQAFDLPAALKQQGDAK